MKEAFGVDAEIIRGKGGVYDVVVDGKLVFSKHATGRFPEDGEVLKLLKK